MSVFFLVYVVFSCLERREPPRRLLPAFPSLRARSSLHVRQRGLDDDACSRVHEPAPAGGFLRLRILRRRRRRRGRLARPPRGRRARRPRGRDRAGVRVEVRRVIVERRRTFERDPGRVAAARATGRVAAGVQARRDSPRRRRRRNRGGSRRGRALGEGVDPRASRRGCVVGAPREDASAGSRDVHAPIARGGDRGRARSSANHGTGSRGAEEGAFRAEGVFGSRRAQEFAGRRAARYFSP